MKTKLCRLEEIPEDGAKPVDFFGREVLVYRHGGQPRAVVSFCQHLGGPLRKEGERLVCAWHGATFAAGDGARESGPCRPDARLLALPIREEGGELFYVYGEG